jgi:regulator of sigma E protease
MLFEAFAIVVMLGILSILIIVHEFGHFSVARYFGFQTPVFGIGLPFGPYKVIGNRWGTQFRVYACLLGGFVAIPELGDESNATQENYGVPLKPFRKFPIWQRALVAFAGVFNNIVFAWLIYFVMLLTMGDPAQAVMVARVVPENPAALAGVQSKDVIQSIDSQRIDNSDDIIHYLTSRPNTKVILHVKRPIVAETANPATTPAPPAAQSTQSTEPAEPPTRLVDIAVTTNANGKVGMELISHGPVHYKPLETNPLQTAGLAGERLVKMTGNMLDAMGQMLQGIFTPKPAVHVPGAKPHLGIDDLHGILAVIAIGADIAKQDWSQLALFTIYISLDLAIINLLPWPALDGFHLATMALESVRRKPMEERVQSEIVKWGFVSLLLLMAVIMVNDVRALMKGELAVKLKGDQIKQATPADENPAPPATAPAASEPIKAPATAPTATPAPANR